MASKQLDWKASADYWQIKRAGESYLHSSHSKISRSSSLRSRGARCFVDFLGRIDCRSKRMRMRTGVPQPHPDWSGIQLSHRMDWCLECGRLSCDNHWRGESWTGGTVFAYVRWMPSESGNWGGITLLNEAFGADFVSSVFGFWILGNKRCNSSKSQKSLYLRCKYYSVSELQEWHSYE